MKKKLISLCVALAMMLVLLPGTVSASPYKVNYPVTGGSLLLEMGDGKTFQVESCGKNVTVAEIPSTLEGFPVTGIKGNAFKDCVNLVSVSIPASVTEIVTHHNNPSFSGCTNLSEFLVDANNPNYTSSNGVLYNKDKTELLICPPATIGDYIVSDGVQKIQNGSFSGCSQITSVVFPESVADVGFHAFLDCTRLSKVTVRGNAFVSGSYAFVNCASLTSIYYENDFTIVEGRHGGESPILCVLGSRDGAPPITVYYPSGNPTWTKIVEDDYYKEGYNISQFVAYTPGNTILPNPSAPTPSNEYIYDVNDLGKDTKLPTDLLEKITDSKSAADAVKQMTDGMTNEQKNSSTGIDLATLYAETAVSKAASKTVEGEVIISADSVADVEAAAKQAASAVETALVNGGVTTARYLSKTVTLTTDETGEITIKIDPDILTTEVDKIRVETPGYALTLKTADLAEDLTEVLTITAEEVGSGFAPGKANRKVTVKVTLPKGRTTNPVTISLPADKGATTYQAVVRTDGSATSSKYNPATTTMDGKVNTSGTYTVQTNEKSFTDISNKSAEMQKAILYLTSKGIINGTSATTFSPNGTINRQQVAALLMRALGKVDNSATVTFKDVSTQSSLYHEIASSKKHKIVNGYSDNTFRGTNVISRAQIVTVAGRVLTSEMNYKAPSNTSTYLAKYSDTVPDFAKEMVALATRENLVVYRTDGTFSGGKNMTRGDAAIILYRLFQRIW